ncbi:unnamed protein product [Haemonchus placei]|uniref:Vps54_N domain-containing protein n=1 Tax=Haemonchus placei TaxID=6290 RepID=A0A158QQY4_HAEPC|nr:unnamed protein product [Haemonchus placei]
MDKLRTSLTKTLKTLGDSFSEDVTMDDMSDYVVSPHDGSLTQDYETNVLGVMKVRPCAAPAPESEDDIIDSIDASYFIEDDFNAIDYEMRKLFGLELRLEDIDRERMRLKSQLQVVSKKISTLIMDKSPSYNAQIEDMDSIRDSLNELVCKIVMIRRALAGALAQSRTALSILANEKKKRMLKTLHSTLRIIKTLYETEFHLRDCIEDGNFPVAIRVCLEAKEAANTYRHFSCVSDLMTKLVGSTNLIETALDSALASFTIVFDHDRYASVYSAYSMLNKVEPASKKLISHFVSTIKKSSQKVVEERCKMCQTLTDTAEISYEDLCQRVSSEEIVSTVRELGYVMCKILTIYHTIIRFHTDDDERKRMSKADDPNIGIMVNQMMTSMHVVFRVALSRMHSFLCSQEFSTLKFDQLLDIVDMANKFRHFGRSFFGYASDELTVSLEKQVVMYFIRYHSERMEELRMFLENECFTLCPVPHQFTIFDLHDFTFLEESRKRKGNIGVTANNVTEEQRGFSIMPADFVNPFGSAEIESQKQPTHMPRSVGELDKTRDERNETEENDEGPDQTPNICNTALNLLRFFGRYIRMTFLLPSIAEYSVPALTQQYEYFFYSICLFFGSDGSETMEPLSSIEAVLSDISDRLIVDESQLLAGGHEKGLRLVRPALCSGLNLSHVDQLYGIVERIIAVESVEFVARQLDLVRPVMESLLPLTSENIMRDLDQFYSKVLSVVPDTRRLVYDCVASRALKYPVLIAAVSNTKWDVNELQSRHSNYVDFMIKDFEGFALRLERVTETIHLNEAGRALLWNRTIYYAFNALVQGYCEGGKCSTEGRALMQLDFQHLILKLEQICNLHPVPHTAFVEGYIKAFYLPENGLEEWISKHTEYTAKQMISLLSVATHVSKKARTRIINALND